MSFGDKYFVEEASRSEPSTEERCGLVRAGPKEAMKMIRALELDWESWGCSPEGSRDTSEPLPEPKGSPIELERYFGHVMEGQDRGQQF